MSDHNQITVRGRVGTDPKLTITANGRTVADFRLGSTRRFRDSSGEWRDAETEWFTVKAWGPMAEAVVTSINRGMPVIAEGTFSTEEWQSGDQTRYRTVITASAIAVDIRYGLVRYVKVQRDATAGGGAPAPGEDGATTADAGAGASGQDDAADSAAKAEEAAELASLEERLATDTDPWGAPLPTQ